MKLKQQRFGAIPGALPVQGGGACRPEEAKPSAAFTLVEVVVSLALAVLIFGGIIMTYIQSGYRAERAGLSLAAQGLAVQVLEQARAARWDSAVDELTNLPAVLPCKLDLPIPGTNYVWATNYTSVSTIVMSSNPPISVRLVRVQTVWPHDWMGKRRYFTNTLSSYYAPDR